MEEELKILRAKYERLIQVSKTLLRPWPVADQSQEDVVHKSIDHPGHQSNDLTVTAPSDSVQFIPEIERIDEILATAQKIRSGQQLSNDSTRKVNSYDKSLKAAAAVYTGNKPAQKTGRDDKMKKVKKESKKKPTVPTGRHPVHVDTGRHPVHVDTGRHPVHVDTGRHPVHVDTGRHPVHVDTGRHPVHVDTGRHPVHVDTGRQVNKGVTMATSINDSTFTLQKNGKSLTLPSKYNHLKKQISQFHFDVKPDIKPTDNVFLKTLLQSTKDEQNDDTFIKLLLLKRELEIIKEELSSITAQNLPSVNEFHSMQDIVKLKLKLKFLIETTDDLFSISQHDLSSFHHFYDHIEETSTKSELTVNIEYIKASIENEFLLICNDHLLPLLQSLKPSDMNYPLLIQSIQKIAGLKKSIFVSLEI